MGKIKTLAEAQRRKGYSQEVLAGAEYGWEEDEVEFD